MRDKNPGKFAGWWGNDIWYLDKDNGTDTSGLGKNDIGRPQSSLTQVLADVGPSDTIYVRPRTTVGTQGTNATKIIASANWTVARANAHLSIIGTGPNGGSGQIIPGVIFQSVASATTPTFKVNAPFFTMENCSIFAIASQVTGLLEVNAFAPGTNDGYGAMIDNCSFHNYGTRVRGAILFDSGRYNTVKNSQFWHNVNSIDIASTGKTVQGCAVRNCDFHGKDTDIDADIVIGDADHIIIDQCRFHHDQPAKVGATYAYYVIVVGASAYGLLSNCYFGTETAETATAVSISNMDACGNWCSHTDSTMVT